MVLEGVTGLDIWNDESHLSRRQPIAFLARCVDLFLSRTDCVYGLVQLRHRPIVVDSPPYRLITSLFRETSEPVPRNFPGGGTWVWARAWFKVKHQV